MRKFGVLWVPLALGVAGNTFAADATDKEKSGKYIEEIVVRGERGDQNSLDRAMTVTGFNTDLISKLGIQDTSDLEVLVPGMQIGPRSQGGGKNEDGHIVMRGVANDRSVNFFQDVSVAVYIDGVYSDQSYGLDQGAMFDVERVEVARGPQGTTGGKASIAGSISFVTKKPTDVFDLKASVEVTDLQSQQLNLAFGGPIGASNFSYRLGLGRMTGDGIIENVGSGPDAGEADELIYSPQLRFKNDRWDVTARYSKLHDEGTPRASLVIGPRNSSTEFLTNAAGQRIETIDTITGLPIRDSSGNIIYQVNPYFGVGQNPAVANCPGFNLDGTRTAGTPVVCDGKDLQLKIDMNAPLSQDNTQEAYTLEAHYQLADSYELVYKYGNRDTRTDTKNDADGTNRQGGGICSPIHPRVRSGELTAGQRHPRCALDGKGNGVYDDRISAYLFTSAQDSHEISLISRLDGPLNYTLGLTMIKGEEPYVFRGMFNGVNTGNNQLNNPTFYTDTTTLCNAELVARFPNALWRDSLTPGTAANAAAPVAVYDCYGSALAANWSDVSNGTGFAVGSGVENAFYGNVEYESKAVYGNAEYVLNDEWKVFGGLRYNDDHKEHNQNDFGAGYQYTNAAGQLINQAYNTARSKYYAGQCCGYIGLGRDALGNPIADTRTFRDSKVKTWRETTWNVGAEYTPTDNLMWYGRISRGYRPGGFAGFGNQLGEAFDAELMINYEAGLKGLFFDQSVQMELSTYFQDFSSFWSQAGRLRTPAELRPGQSIFTGETVSVDGTQIAGIELQGAWQINDRLSLRGFAEYMYSSFGDYMSAYCCTAAGTTAPASTTTTVDANGNTITVINTGLLNFGGHSLRSQPKYKFSGTLAYDVPMPSNMGRLGLVTIMSWRDKMYMDEANLDIFSVPSYTRWDVRANWSSPSGSYTVTGWVTNLLDEIAVQGYSPREGNGVTAPVNGTVTDPRRIGLTLGYQL